MKNQLFFFVLFLATIGMMSSCSSESENNSTNLVTANQRQLKPNNFKVVRGTLKVTASNIKYCDPDMTNICHLEESEWDGTVVPLDWVNLSTWQVNPANTGVVKMKNLAPSTIGSINISVANDLPASFAINQGYSSIELQTGVYPKLFSPSDPNGYYLLNVVFVP